MKKSVALSGFAAILVGVGLLGFAQRALGQTSTHPHPPKSSAPKTQTFVIVQIGEEYKVISSSSLKDEKKRITDDNKKKREEWEDDRKSDPTLKQPTPLVLKVIQTGFKTQKGADDFVAKLKEKEKGVTKDTKDGKTPGDKQATY